ncbi:hypothetical protein GMOD_00007257 [Pyrenophora seminiperda CCB06]|uniref:Uncharacterized protein n=1 Tax=Pyrenophora seminiperda CCB06 TaxID=1302712 RepID=A0A3M7MCL8_9PLEO|nr:hypothetical protein GMOD_00007257 [Pyrenophora seminiperda CCB06]
MSPPDAPVTRKPPGTYGKRPARVEDSSQQRGAFASNDSEAKGEQAFDKIRRQVRSASDFRASARRAVNAIHGPFKTGSREKATINDSLPKRSLKITDVRRRNGVHHNISQEEDDVARAMIMSLSSHNMLSQPSIAAGPYDALSRLMDMMKTSRKWLDEGIHEQNIVASRIAGCVNSWQATLFKVIYAAKTAEDKRIEDVKLQLRFDQKVQEKHQKDMDERDQMWEDRVVDMQYRWQKSMDEQKQMYEARIAEQKSTHVFEATLEEQRPTVKHSQPRTVNSPSLYTHDEVLRLGRKIAALNSKHAATITELERGHHDETSHLKQKAERLADTNTVPRQSQKIKDEMKKHALEESVPTFGAQVENLQGTAKTLDANTDSELIQGRAIPPEPLCSQSKVTHDKEQTDYQITRSESRWYSGGLVSRKRKLKADMFEGADHPRKRAGAWSTE